MKDYYSLLRVPKSASIEEIRRSYKKLAMMYHPDKNPGNKHAEDEFKLINEAYQVLSDPDKKRNYDNLLLYDEFQGTGASSSTHTTYSTGSRKPPPPSATNNPKTRYIFDEKYYKSIKISIVIFIVMMGSVIASYQVREYNKRQKTILEQNILSQKLNRIYTLVSENKYDSAIYQVYEYIAEAPLNYSFKIAKDSVFKMASKAAFSQYNNEKYKEATFLFQLLRKHNSFRYDELIEPIIYSYIRGGLRDSAIQILTHRIENNDMDVSSVILMSKIQLNELHQIDIAKTYIDEAKEMFKKTQTITYGKAFEMVMDVKKAPDVYFDLFILRAEINEKLQQYSEAYTDGNWATFLRPDNAKGYEIRLQNGLKIKKYTRTCMDIKNLERLNITTDQSLKTKYCK